jgi:hypothetical protein
MCIALYGTSIHIHLFFRLWRLQVDGIFAGIADIDPAGKAIMHQSPGPLKRTGDDGVDQQAADRLLRFKGEYGAHIIWLISRNDLPGM